MQIAEVLNERISDRGIPISELGRRTNIDHQLLRRSLRGIRPLRAEELVSLSRELNLTMSDFYEKSA